MSWPEDRLRVTVKRRARNGELETLAFWDPEPSQLPRTLAIALATAQGAHPGAVAPVLQAWVETRRLSVAGVGAP